MVSFQVKKEDWPDLHRWLSSIIRPGERSLRIREALHDVAMIASGKHQSQAGRSVQRHSDVVVESPTQSRLSQQNLEVVHDPEADEGAISGMMDQFR